MNSKLYLPILFFSMTTFSLLANQQEDNAGIKVSFRDTTVQPGADFYRYACGGWIQQHPLTPEYSRYGTFEELMEQSRNKLRTLIEELSSKEQPKGTIAHKINRIYNMVTDSVTLNAQGYLPIQNELKNLESINKKDFPALMGSLQRTGLDVFFNCYVDADMKDSRNNLVQLSQSGLSLNDKDYYLSDDESTAKIREAYKEHIYKMFCLAGYSKEEARRKMKDVLEIETRLARTFYSKVELRDPEANYHKISFGELQNTYPDFDWIAYFNKLGLKEIKEVSVSQLQPIKESIHILRELSPEKLTAYLQWKLIDASAAYLSDDFYVQNFDFYGRTLSGKEEPTPRWKRGIALLDQSVGEAVGQMFVEKYFPASAKERMLKLVKNLQKALGQRIDAQEWMDQTTKEKAHEKLNTFHIKIGYPDKWRDYSGLSVDETSLWEIVKNANTFEYDYMINQAGKPVDRDRWYMTPQTVNAYYNPTTNEICFPAGILQYPFFDMEADDAFNYGAIGVVIGHEMTHGFDDQGRQFDKDGNLNDWWTKKDAEKFNARAQVMVDFFDKIEVLPGLHANGKLTLGENLADHGGLKIAFQAYKNATAETPEFTKQGYTPEQRFFLSYAALWADNIRDEQIRVYTKTDPHSLGRWRVNGALPHIEEWYKAFDISSTDPLYIEPQNRVEIW